MEFDSDDSDVGLGTDSADSSTASVIAALAASRCSFLTSVAVDLGDRSLLRAAWREWTWKWKRMRPYCKTEAKKRLKALMWNLKGRTGRRRYLKNVARLAICALLRIRPGWQFLSFEMTRLHFSLLCIPRGSAAYYERLLRWLSLYRGVVKSLRS